jgi:hypothetical protein
LRIVVPATRQSGQWRTLFLSAGLHTFVANLLLRLVFVAHTEPLPGSFFVVALMGSVPAVAAVLTYERYPTVRGGRLFAYAILCAAGLAFWSELTKLLLYGYKFHAPLLCRDGVTLAFVVPSQLVPLSLVGSLVAWLVCRLVKGRVVIQDGTLCPKCGYSLAGNISRICPECGREYTYQELGTTPEQLLGPGSQCPMVYARLPLARPLAPPRENEDQAPG